MLAVDFNNFKQQKARQTNTVYDQIVRFLREYKGESVHTYKNYKSDIKHFFKTTRGKELEEVEIDDLDYTIEEFEDYYAYLLDVQKVSKTTANRYISSIRELFKHFKRRGVLDNISFINIKTFKGVSRQHGVLTPEEVEEALKTVLKQGRKDTALVKHMLIKFSTDTGARLEECLSLKWSNFSVEDEFVTIHTRGKGNKEFKARIGKSFYNDLLKIKKPGVDRVFNIHRNTVNNMMKQLREDMNIPEERKIVFHSFRKAAITHNYRTHRDIIQASKKANHSSIMVTERYIDKEEDYGSLGMFSMREGIDPNLFKNVGLETLVKAIEQMDSATKTNINLKIKNMLDKDSS